MKSLVVDDDITCASIFKTVLSRYGICDVLSNGLDAVESYKASVLRGSPHQLIILDIMMPDMNGHEVLKQIRAFEESRNIYPPDCTKVIITTALDDEENRKIEKELIPGCEAYLVKSGDPQDFIDKIREVGIFEV